ALPRRFALPLAVDANFAHPQAQRLVPIQALDASRVVGSHCDIALVVATGGYPQVSYDVVRPVAIDMVDLNAFGYLAVMKYPDNAVRPVMPSRNAHAVIAGRRIQPSGGRSFLCLIPTIHLPDKAGRSGLRILKQIR